MFQFFRKRRAEKQTAYKLYKELVEQARRPVFYTDYKVADTIEGRFDMILLHLFLIDDRLEQAGNKFMSLRRYLQEAMVSDMDRSFREIGVGDMSVGKEMKKVGSAWLGRQKAYADSFLEDAPAGALSAALSKNLYSDRLDAPVVAMASYVHETREVLASTEIDSILDIKFIIPLPKSGVLTEKASS